MSTRTILEFGSRCVRAWWFWAFVLLVIPNCTLETGGYCVPGEPCPADDCPNKENPECKPPCPDPENPDNPECKPVCPDPDNPDNPDCVDPPVCPNPDDPNDPNCVMPPVKQWVPGANPVDAIMCDFPAPVDPILSECATPSDIADPNNLLFNQAATALATGRSSTVGLDYSPAADIACGSNVPKKVTFIGGEPFPNGNTVCINYDAQIPSTYATAAKACVVKCEDVINFGNGYKPADVHGYCVANARTSTNYAKDDFKNACTPGGNPVMPPFDEPRKYPEKVEWTDFIGATAGAGTDFNTLSTTITKSGAASTQIIASGDAWVEFSAGENDRFHAVSLRNTCVDLSMCQDVDAELNDMGFALFLAGDNMVYTAETAPVLNIHGPFGQYTPGERYRVKAVDNHDGTANISYTRLTAACVPGTQCAEELLFTSPAPSTAFPLRVDANLHDPDSSLTNVTIVRIKP